MAWSPNTLLALQGDRRKEVWLVEVYSSMFEPGADGYTISSCDGFGDETLLAGPPTIAGPKVSPVSWSSTIGEASIPLVGDLSTLRQHMTRGTVVRVLWGLSSYARDDFEVVFWGQVWNLAGSGITHTLQVRDALQVLQSRLTTDHSVLFWTLPSTTLAGSMTDVVTSFQVADVTSLMWDQYGEGIGLCKIGDEYITFTAVNTGTNTVTTCVRGQLGSTAAVHSAGDTVQTVVYLTGHPFDVVRRVLLSHSESGNSVWDDYDTTWGLGVRQTLVDLDDIDRWRNTVTVASGTYSWGVVSETVVDDPSSWLSDILARSALFLTMRQGLLTLRAALSPLTTTGYPACTDFLITDDDLDLDADPEVEWFASEYSTEYLKVTVESESSSTSTTTAGDGFAVATLPGSRELTYSIADYVRSNESEVRTEVLNRVALFAQRVPEALTVTCASMRCAQLAPGEVVYLASTRIQGRLSYTTGTTGRRCWVAQVSPDWAANRVRVRLLAYPATENAFDVT